MNSLKFLKGLGTQDIDLNDYIALMINLELKLGIDLIPIVNGIKTILVRVSERKAIEILTHKSHNSIGYRLSTVHYESRF